ncbi:dTDP-4-dehydrorhamnose reductase [Mangrovicella endophytica]|uniref:dTDP-4-dehydrorhamnose reductase n=1 Tax=Mangrovicella endophytica TaxID=2066697 RepID=UPI000C9E3611|nr:dTDP-4-dehydrorhamnose reductase [Mangrovicella endophytica]
MRVLVTGTAGQVSQSLQALSSPEIEIVAVGRPRLDLADPASVAAAIEDVQPHAVVNAAAYTAVDKAESDETAAFAVNRDGAGAVAAAAAAGGIPIVHLSTDYVFPGDKTEPYQEADIVGPTSVYGRSKLAGEQAVAAANPAHVILRTAWVYSPYGANFVKTMLRLAADRDTVRVVADQQGTPTHAGDIAAAIAIVLQQIAADPQGSSWRGVFHMTGSGETSWAGFAEAIFAASRGLGGPSAVVQPITTAEYPTPARRPANSRLSNARFRSTFGHSLPDWQDGTRRCVAALLGR